jgi:hypothetical protein
MYPAPGKIYRESEKSVGQAYVLAVDDKGYGDG